MEAVKWQKQVLAVGAILQTRYHGRRTDLVHIGTRDHLNYTPSCRAAHSGSMEVIRSLLHCEANSAAQSMADQEDRGWTQLAEACHHANSDIVELSLDKGADTEIANVGVRGDSG